MVVPFSLVPPSVLAAMEVPNCSVCGEPVLSKMPFHTICRMALTAENGCLPQVFVIGVFDDGA